ncbi:hypothetical protein [Flavobacterium sp.]|uniref:hypothetical protein n=1 Tax=Flavobacterium sp. TaxID=239 RepID=UPI00374D7528
MENKLWKLFDELFEMENKLKDNNVQLWQFENEFENSKRTKLNVLSKKQVEDCLALFEKVNSHRNDIETKKVLNDKCCEIANIIFPLINSFIDAGNGKIIGLFADLPNTNIPEYRTKLKVGNVLTTGTYSLLYEGEQTPQSTEATM